MKKILFAVAISTQLVLVSFAQNGSSDGSFVHQYKNKMGRSEVKINAMRDFTNRFGDVEDAMWSSNGDRMRAKFTKEDILHMIDYDRKGKWVSTIDVYDENKLRSDVRKIVKSNYIDYAIVKVIEVKIGKSQVHFVKLENESMLLTLHIKNGEITEMENYRKG